MATVVMKEITAIVRPEKVAQVCDALEKIEHRGMTVQEVGGWGKEKTADENWKGERYRTLFSTKALLRIIVPELEVKRVVDELVKAAWTGNVGDGKVFVKSVDQVWRIRWGEKGEGVF